MSNSSARIKDSHFFIVLLVRVLLYEIHVFLEKIVSEILCLMQILFFTCCSFKLWPNVWNSWIYQKLLLQWSLQHWRKKGLLPVQLLFLRWKVRNSIDHFLFLHNQLAKINRSQRVLGSNPIWSLDFFPSSHLTLCISMALCFKTSSLRRLAGCIPDILP